jgi:hypothetical protein
LTYDDVALPAGRLADKLRADQYKMFRGESWLADHLERQREERQAQSVTASGSLQGDSINRIA